MKIILEPSEFFRYAFEFKYTVELIEYCRWLKVKYGWKEINFNNEKWRFNNLEIAQLILSRFPQTVIDEKLYNGEYRKFLLDRERDNMVVSEAAKIKEKKDSDLVIKGLKKDIYPYQKLGVEFFINNGGKAILADTMGLGKTVQSLAYVVHEKLDKTIVVCPSSVKYSWESEVCKWTKLKPFVIDAKKKSLSNGEMLDIYKENDVFIINYDILKNFYAFFSVVKIDCIILDEFHYCFTGETKILTDKGYIRIDEIVNSKMPLSVASCNLSTNDIEYNKILNFYKNPIEGDLIRIKHQYGEIICTPNHRIWTENGYKEAILLSDRDCLSTLSEEIYNKEEGKINSEILQWKMCWSFCKHSTSDKSGYKEERPTNREKVRSLWKSLYQKTMEQTKILQYKLCGKMEDKSTRNKIENLYGKQDEKIIQIHDKSSFKKPSMGDRSIKENEEDDEKSRFFKKIESWFGKIPQREPDIPSQGRKWTIDGTSKKNSVTDWVANGICYINKGGERKVSLFTKPLQSRPSLPREKNSNRNRWFKPFNKKVEILRQKKDRNLKLSRVESVEILEQGSYRRHGYGNKKDKFVYNLEIANNNNYFANNTLVSNCKNIQAQRTKIAKKLVMGIPRRLLLSGTPLLSRPAELFNGLQMMDPANWHDWYGFTKRYCGGHQGIWGWDYRGSSNVEELQGRISRYFLRRKKEDVLPELPDKIFIDVPVQLSPEKKFEYDLAHSDFMEYLDKIKKKDIDSIRRSMSAESLVKLGELRRVTSDGKVNEAIELIQDIIDSGEKVVVFSCYNDPLKKMADKFKEQAVMLTGDTPEMIRRDVIKQFQDNPEVKVFLGGMKSAGVGITLTAGSNVVFLDFSWVPGDHNQSMDRIHRIGQTANKVNIYQLFAKDTIDEKMKEMLEGKQEIFDKLIEGSQEENDAERQGSLVKELLMSYQPNIK